MPFTSESAIMGRKRTNNRKRVRKSPNVPTNVMMSMIVGRKYPQDDGRKSRCSEVAMITKRSNHMPMLVVMEMANMIGMLVRIFLNQNNCGMTTLHVIID